MKHQNIVKHYETLEQSSFDATISALDAETLALGAATSAIARSFWRYWRGVIGDCGVGVTPQLCNRVTNHGDMGTFSRPACRVVAIPEAIGGCAVADVAMPIVARLAKHHKTLLNIVKHHETCKTL